MADILVRALALSPVLAAIFSIVVIIRMDQPTFPRIKFKDFKKFYELNPKRWRCETDYVICQINAEYDCEAFMFNFVDKCKYKLWLRNRNKRDVDQENMKSVQRMLDAVKKDVAKAKVKEEYTSQVTAFKSLLEELRNMNTTTEMPSLAELLKKYGVDEKE